MAMHKAIAHGKEKRAEYRGCKFADRTCRNHGSCNYCKGNRLYNVNKRLDMAAEKMLETEMNRPAEELLKPLDAEVSEGFLFAQKFVFARFFY